MTSAIYGRMRMGRCLDSEDPELFETLGKNSKYLRCSENVMHLMNKKCSGKNQCEVRLSFDKDFESLKPCYDGLQLYLEASYDCVTGLFCNFENCNFSNHVKFVRYR